MYYTLMGRVVWTAHRTEANAMKSARKLTMRWAHKGYRFCVQQIRHKWTPGDTPSARNYIGSQKATVLCDGVVTQ